ncbi:autotransporter family protein [Taklimakanibacter deserti]|uniref:autotransporter family protein n=1 Tax=Taklimakanibacter deserti TaxID=2267839 RepID=UPI000E655E42
MRRNSLTSLLSTTSLAAFAVLAGTATVDRTAWAIDTFIITDTSTPQTIAGNGDTLTVTGGAELEVSTATAVTMSNNNTSLTVGLTTGTPPNVGAGTVTGIGQSAVLANAFTGMNILVNSNGTIRADADATSATIEVLPGAGLDIDNHGTIANLGATTGANAIHIAGSATVSIDNTKLDPGDPTPTISAAAAAAIHLVGSGTVTGAITNDGLIVTGNQNFYGGGAIRFLNSTLTGGVTNNVTGVIQGDAGGRGIEFAGTGSSADISNAGTITQVNGGTDGQGIFYFLDATSTVTNSGLIQASATGSDSGAIVFDSLANVTGAVDNQADGVIRATGQGASAISFEAGASLSGAISNAGTIEVTDATGPADGFAIKADSIDGAALSIANTTGGLIRGAGTTGGAIAVLSPDVAVNITNNGFITNASSNGNSRAINVDGSFGTGMVTIDNQNGTISNTGSGTAAIEILGGAAFTINNGLGDGLGAIVGGSGRAVLITSGTGDITNNSVITSAAGGGTIFIESMEGSIVNQFFGTIQHTASNGTAVFLNGTLAGDGVLDNAGIIRGGTGGNLEFLGTADNGRAIFADIGTATTIINRDTGIISGSVSIGHGTFTIEGGIINGNIIGLSGSKVDYDLAAVTLETTPGDGGFNPLTGPFGFETNGIHSLNPNSGPSSINVNSGALFVHQNMQAADFLIAAGAVMRLDDNVTVQVGLIPGSGFDNNGLLFVAGGDTATISAPVSSAGAGNMLGFGIAHPTAGAATYGKLNVNSFLGITQGDLVTDTDTSIRIYNDFLGFTPAATGIVLADVEDDLTIDGATNVAGTLADMDTAYNDTLTLRFIAYVGGPDDNDLLLDVIRTPLDAASFGLTPNQRNAASALESIGQNGNASGQLNAFLGLLDSITEEDELANALEQTLPIANGAALMGSVIAFDSVLQSIDSRLAGLNPGSSGNEMAMAAELARGTRVSPAADVVEPYAPQSALWVRIGGGTGEQDEQDGPGGPVAGWDGDSWYGVVGADAEVSQGLRLGATLAYVDSTFDGDDVNDSRLEIQSYQGSLYGAWESDGWWATGVVGGGWNDYDGRRSIDVSTPGGDFSDTKTSDYDGWQVTARAMVGTVIGDVAGPNIAPFVSLRYSYIDIGAYDEDGDSDEGLSLEVDDQDYEQLLPGIGVRLAAPIIGDGHAVVPWLRASYQYDVIGDRQVTTSTFGGDLGAPQASFVTKGVRPGRDVLNLGGGLSFFSSDALSAALSVDWEDREDYDSWSGFGEVRFAF